MKIQKSKILLATSLILSVMAVQLPAYSDQSDSQRESKLPAKAAQNVQALKSMIHQYEVDANQLEHISRDLGISLSDLRSTQSELSATQNQLSILRSEKQQLKNQIINQQDELAQKEDKLDQVVQNIQNLRSKKQQKKQAVDGEKRKLQPLKAKLDQQTSKRNNLQAKLNQATRQKTQLQKQINQDRAKIKNSKNNLEKNKKAIIAFNNQIKTAEQNAKAANRESIKLKQQAKAKQAEITKLQAKMKTLPPRSPERRKIVGQIRTLKVQQNKLNKAAQTKAMVAKRNEKVKANAQKKKRTLVLSNKRLKTDIQVAKARVQTNKPKLTQTTNKIAKLQPKLRDAQAQQRLSQQKYNTASKKLKTLQAQLSNIKSKLQAKRERKQKLQNKIVRLDDSIQSKKRLLSTKRQRIQSLRVEKRSLSSRVSQLQLDVQNLESREDQKISSLENASTTTHNGKLLHIAIGATHSLGRHIQQDINDIKQSGGKAIFWIQGEPSSSLINQYGDVMGLDSARSEYVSNLSGESVLNAMQISINSNSMTLNPTHSVTPLLISAVNQVLMTANTESGTPMIASGLDPMKISEQKLARIMRKIKKASPDQFVGGDTPNPVDPPSAVTKTVELNDLNLAIPDNNSEGVEQKIVLDADSGLKIESMELDLSIEHTYIGDLKVEIVHPSGASIILHSNQGGEEDLLNLSLKSEDLGAFLGLEATGKYSILITDSAARDIGTLASVFMKVTMQ